MSHLPPPAEQPSALAWIFLWICCLVAASGCAAPVASPYDATLSVNPISLTLPAESEQSTYATTAHYGPTPGIGPLIVDSCLGVADELNILAWGRVKVNPALTEVSTGLLQSSISEQATVAGTADTCFVAGAQVPMGLIWTRAPLYRLEQTYSRNKNYDSWIEQAYDELTTRQESVTVEAAEPGEVTLDLTKLFTLGKLSNDATVSVSTNHPFQLATKDGRIWTEIKTYTDFRTGTTTMVTNTTFTTLTIPFYPKPTGESGLYYAGADAKLGTTLIATTSESDTLFTVTLQDSDRAARAFLGADSLIGTTPDGVNLSQLAGEQWKLFIFTLHAGPMNWPGRTLYLDHWTIDHEGLKSPAVGRQELHCGVYASGIPNPAVTYGSTVLQYLLPAGSAFWIGVGDSFWPFYLSAANPTAEAITTPLELQTYGAKLIRGHLSESDFRAIYIADKAELIRRGLW